MLINLLHELTTPNVFGLHLHVIWALIGRRRCLEMFEIILSMDICHDDCCILFNIPRIVSKLALTKLILISFLPVLENSIYRFFHCLKV